MAPLVVVDMGPAFGFARALPPPVLGHDRRLVCFSKCRRKFATRPWRATTVAFTETGGAPGARTGLSLVASELHRRLSIEDVVRRRGVQVKRTSDDSFRGLCPFHEEKTPSFTVTPSLGTFHCFGCGASGNGIQFVQRTEIPSFVEAMRTLAVRYEFYDLLAAMDQGQYDPAEVEAYRAEKERYTAYCRVTESATRYYEDFLSSQPAARPVLEYLANERKISPETSQKFRLGFAPFRWSMLCEQLEETYGQDALVETGLAGKRKTENKGLYDFFRGRLMVPIRDRSGGVIGFGGRVVPGVGDEAISGSGKYINSPETTLFRKSEVLFGAYEMNLARRTQPEFVVVVEGYMDVIALHQAGITNAVGVLGTAISDTHIIAAADLSRARHVVINLDSDDAGSKAVNKLCDQVLPKIQNVQVRIAQLPDNCKDCDEYLRKNSAADYQSEVLDNAVPWVQWDGERVIQSIDRKTTVEEIVNAIDSLARLLHKAYPGSSPKHRTARAVYAERFGQMLSVRQTRQDFVDISHRIHSSIASLRGEGQPVAKRSRPKPAYRQSKNDTYQKVLESQVETAESETSKLNGSVELFLSAVLRYPECREWAIDFVKTRRVSFFREEQAILMDEICCSSLDFNALVDQLSERFASQADEDVSVLLERAASLSRECRFPHLTVELYATMMERFWSNLQALKVCQARWPYGRRIMFLGLQQKELREECETLDHGDPRRDDILRKIERVESECNSLISMGRAFEAKKQAFQERGRLAREHQVKLELQVNPCDSDSYPSLNFDLYKRFRQ